MYFHFKTVKRTFNLYEKKKKEEKNHPDLSSKFFLLTGIPDLKSQNRKPIFRTRRFGNFRDTSSAHGACVTRGKLDPNRRHRNTVPPPILLLDLCSTESIVAFIARSCNNNQSIVTYTHAIICWLLDTLRKDVTSHSYLKSCE